MAKRKQSIPPETASLRVQSLVRLIEKELKNTTIRSFSELSDVSVSTISHLINGGKNVPERKTVLKLGEGAQKNSGTDPDKFLLAAGYDPIKAASDEVMYETMQKISTGTTTGVLISLNYLIQKNPMESYNICPFRSDGSFVGSYIIHNSDGSKRYFVLPGFSNNGEENKSKASILERIFSLQENCFEKEELKDMLVLIPINNREIAETVKKVNIAFPDLHIQLILTRDFISVLDIF